MIRYIEISFVEFDVQIISVPTHPFRHYKWINIPILQGQALRISGKNGVGKTTVLKILAGYYIIPGIQPLRSCSWLPSEPMLLEGMAVKSQLRFYQTLGEGNPSWLQGCVDKQIHELSKGQKQLLHLTKLLYSSANIWLLDEPFTALDNDHTKQFSDIMDRHILSGGAVIYSSHENNRKQDQFICLDSD